MTERKKTPEEFFAKFEKKEARRIKREKRQAQRAIHKYENPNEYEGIAWAAAIAAALTAAVICLYFLSPLWEKA